MSGYYAFDLDGTLAHYDGTVDKIGRPIAIMIDRVKALLAQGREARIFTARVHKDHDGRQRRLIEEWCRIHIGQKLEVTCCKDYAMICLFDDRAVAVEENTGRLLSPDPTRPKPALHRAMFK